MKHEEQREIKVSLETAPRVHDGVEYTNLYLIIDGKRFELVPHARTVKEKALFYGLLSRSPLALKK